MNTGGWIILIIMWGTIIGLGIFCFGRIFMDKKSPSAMDAED